MFHHGSERVEVEASQSRRVAQRWYPSLLKTLGRSAPLDVPDSLQVIVKVADYVLPVTENEHTGSWHIEGMPHGDIIASAIYYGADPRHPQ